MAAKPKPRQPGKRRGAPIPVRAAGPVRDGGDLCLGCGLCCDGTVFVQLLVLPDEQEFVEGLGLEVQEQPNGMLSALEPCPAFTGGCCSLYEVGRPHTCHQYRCSILDAYLGGRAPLDDCLAVVRLVRSVVRDIEVATGMERGTHTRRALQAWLEEHRPWEDPDTHRDVVVAFSRMHLLGVHWFGYEPIGAEQATADAGEAVVDRSTPL